jgi:hypothetical protein
MTNTMTLTDAVTTGRITAVTATALGADAIGVTIWPHGTNVGGQMVTITADAARELAASLLRAAEGR